MGVQCLWWYSFRESSVYQAEGANYWICDRAGDGVCHTDRPGSAAVIFISGLLQSGNWFLPFQLALALQGTKLPLEAYNV
jgi:hypothetical protein